jgi:hypothetical protein
VSEVEISESDLVNISTLPSMAGWRSYEIMIEANLRALTEALLKKPQVDDTNFKKDFRHQLGFINGLKYALELQKDCMEKITNE